MQALFLIPIVFCILSGLFFGFYKRKSLLGNLFFLSVPAVALFFSFALFFAENDLSVELLALSDDLILLLKADLLGKIFGFLFSLIWLIVAVYAVFFLKEKEDANRFYAFDLLTLGAMLALSYSGNALTMYAAFESVTLASMPLVLFDKTPEAKKAALKYLFYSLGGAFLGLTGVVAGIVFSSNGGEFVFGGTLNIEEGSRIFVQTALLLSLIGFGAKCGVFPLQAWLPSAHPVAPAPASALLSGVITKAGVIAIIRLIFYVYGADLMRGSFVQYVWESLLLVTILLGSSLAVFQQSFKRRLAYSSISQLSYVLLGVCALNEDGFVGSLLHIGSHAFIKVGLFLIAGILISRYSIHRVDEMEGIGKRAPATMACFTLLSLALIGIPPSGAFFSKWFLALGSIENGMPFFNYFGAVVLLISAILTACYLLPISISAFFPKTKGEFHREKEPLGYLIPVVILTLGVFALGFASGSVSDFIRESVLGLAFAKGGI